MKVFKIPESHEHVRHVSQAYAEEWARDVQIARDDPRPSIPHDEVMRELDMEIAKLRR
jgi:hypothetical protein